MHATVDLGLLSLVLVVCLAFPVIGFVIRRKWRLAVARKEEIKRLLVLASEEVARAELEASAGYGSISVALNYQCAVCYCPTTTRCARCKAVRYCSGKCQVIHWRKGHKEECYPPSTTHQNVYAETNSTKNAAEQEEFVTYGERFEIGGRQHENPIETFHEEPALSSSSCSPEVSCGKGDDIKVELFSDGKGTNSASESSSTSFSGFTASTSRRESSDDVSTSESISTIDSEKPDRRLSADSAHDMFDTTISVENVDQTKPLSPKFASLVNTADNFTDLSKLNRIKPGCSGGESRCTSTSSSGLSIGGMSEGSIGEPCTVSAGFWGTTLDSFGSRNEAHDESAPSDTRGTDNSNSSDSKSFLRFAFNLSGSAPPALHAQGSEVKGNISDDVLPASLGINKPADGDALSETISVDVTKVKNSLSLNCERSDHMDYDTSNDSHASESREVKSLSSTSSYVHVSSSTRSDSLDTYPSNGSSLPSSCSEKSNNAANCVGNTPHLLKAGKVGCLSSSASGAHPYSIAGGYSVPSVKSGKVSVHTSAGNSSQDASYSPNARNGLKTSVLNTVDQLRVSKLPKQHPLSAGSEIAGRYSDKGLFPYGLFVKLYNWNKVELLRPCGLINCGNSCYANAVLQCLAFTPPLTAYFLQGLHSKTCVRKEWCFTCEFESLILKAKEGKFPLSPVRILTQLQNMGSKLGNGREEDAHEFLRYAIDTMQSVCLKESGVKASRFLEEDTTLIGLTFGGYLRSKIKCTKCQGKSEQQERMMDLTVEIGGDIETLEEALRRFTGTEILDGENKYQCSRCKSYERAKKNLSVLEAPNILPIALKRFQSGKFGKLNKSIRFPEILDLAPYMTGTSDKSPIYRLYGVIVHLDIMNSAFSGHYVCYVKNMQNKWFKIDDSTVTAVERERVLMKGAYMLLYARCSPRAPRLIRNITVSPDPKTEGIPSRNRGKNSTSKSRAASTQSSAVQLNHSSIHSDGPASFESFYSRFHRLQKILEVDSSSDNSSLISSNSDEGSCSTESTRDSASTDDLSDYIFGDSGHCWNSPLRNFSDSDSSSSSPLYSTHSPLADLDRSASGFPETSWSRTDYGVSGMESDGLRDDRLPNGSSRPVDMEGKGSVPFLQSEMTKQCRKLASSSSSERLGWVNPFSDVKSGVSFRKPTRERTD